jgi:acyl carrier protein
MTHNQPTREEIQAVFPKVAATMADALGCDLDKVKLEASLIDDLGAESIDFLDIVFRLERAFKVKIPRGKIVEESRGDLSEAEFEQGGQVTPAGLERLKAFLSEVPAGPVPLAAAGGAHPAFVHHRNILQTGHPATTRPSAPRATPSRLIGRSFGGMNPHFRAFSFVDRITRLEPGVSASGAGTPCPAGLVDFPISLAAEAVGQLAAWAAMAALDFRFGRRRHRRPGRTLAAGPTRHGARNPRAPQDRGKRRRRLRRRGAHRTDRPVVQLEDCVGPMVNVSDFDDRWRSGPDSNCSAPEGPPRAPSRVCPRFR